MKTTAPTSLVAVATLATLALGVALPACGGAPESRESGEVTEHTASEITLLVTGSEAVARAEEWVTAAVPYCQSANHEADPDTSCAATCTRPDVPAWDPYRSDCSGLVSWAWGLAAPGRVTWELAPGQTDITHTIDATTLAPGDAVNKPHDHTMLFKAWITPGKRAVFLEEPGCSASPPHARETVSDVTISGTSITVAANGITFDAIHFDALLADDAGTGGDAHDAGAGDDASAGDDAGGSSTADAGTDDAAAISDAEPPATSDAVDAASGGPPAESSASMSAGCSTSSQRNDTSPFTLVVVAGAMALARRRARKSREARDAKVCFDANDD